MPPPSRLHRPWAPPADFVPLDLQQIPFPQAGSTQLPPDPLGRGRCINLTQSESCWQPQGRGTPTDSTDPGDEEDWDKVDHPSMVIFGWMPTYGC